MSITKEEKIEALEDAISFIEHHEGSSDCELAYCGDNEETVKALEEILKEIKTESEE